MAVARISAAIGIVAAMLFAGCTSRRTEVLVAVDTDLSVPSELSAISIRVTGPNGTEKTADSDLATDGGVTFPRTLGLVYESGPTFPVTVVVEGQSGNATVNRTARFGFVPDQTVVLYLRLERSCLRMSCGTDMTCAGGTCRAIDLANSELSAWTGSIDTVDACAGANCLCGGTITPGKNLSNDPANCKSCGNECPTPASFKNQQATCANSTCGVECKPGFADCDGFDADGCERRLGTNENCSRCGDSCRNGSTCCSFSCRRTCPGG